jgi:hypothetical protein
MLRDMSVKGDNYLLEQHIKKICTPNLLSNMVTFCSMCPFEDIIVAAEPTLKEKFVSKRSFLLRSKTGQPKLKFK